MAKAVLKQKQQKQCSGSWCRVLQFLKDNWKSAALFAAIIFLYSLLVAPRLEGSMNVLVKEEFVSNVLFYVLLVLGGFLSIYLLADKDATVVKSLALSIYLSLASAVSNGLVWSWMIISVTPSFLSLSFLYGFLFGVVLWTLYGGLFVFVGALIALAVRKYLLVAKT